MKSWKITIGQVVSVPLDIKKNTDKALDLMDQCASDKSSLLVLPELYLSGYEIKDFISSPSGAESIKKDVATALTRIADKTQESGCDILISYPLFRSESDKPYIALDYYSKGRSIASHRKINLCNYAQYTEHLTFSEGDQVTVADAPCCKAGMFVCEDLWHVTNAIFAAKLGAEVLFYPSAATVIERSGAENCFANWKKLTIGTAFSQTSYVICCNHAESPDAKYFGGSHIVDPNGDIVLELPLFDEAIMNFEIDLSYIKKIREIRPLLNNERFGVYKKYMK